MNGEGGIGSAEEDLAYLRGEFVTGIDFGSAYPGGFYPDISMGFFPSLPQTFFELPPILPRPSTGTYDPEGPATTGIEGLPPFVVDPEEGQASTVFEGANAPYVAPRTRETDWDWVYDQYVILNPPDPTPEVEVVLHESIDWGSAVGTILGGILDPFGVGQYARTALAPQPTVTSALPVTSAVQPGRQMVQNGGCPPHGPKYAKICLATNEITPLRRRRRRRLLTSSDIKDLAALKAIVGGAALQGAVVQAIRR